MRSAPEVEVARATAASNATLRGAADLLALTKPKVTRLVVFTGGVGMWLAPAGLLTPLRVALTLIGTVLVVSAANALNMYLERDIDGLMARTADRPLPAGRLTAASALGFGLTLALISVPLLALGVNPLTGLLALLALVDYGGLYTPMKQRSWAAVLVGAIPGAMPPLMGYTAATGRIGAPGAALFAIMFLWQGPHTLAITLFRHADYLGAGFQTMPVQLGEAMTRKQAFAYSPLLVLSSVVPYLIGSATLTYLVVALVLGAGFLAFAALAAQERGAIKWARGLFAYSIVYLTVLFGTLFATVPHV